MAWYQKKLAEVWTELETDRNGLTSQEAERRLNLHGLNTLAQEEGVNLFKLLIGQVKSPLIYILIFAGVVTLALGEFIDSAVIFFVILLNGVVGFIQEYRAEKSVRSLQKMINPKAGVMRNGEIREIDSFNLVPGDVVYLISGSMVPADVRLFRLVDLKIDESMLTGESLPAEKHALDISEENLTPGDQKNMAFMGTIVVSGRARGVVVDTGQKTILGSIADDIRSIGTVKAPIQEKINRLAHAIGLLVLAACVTLFALGILMGESAAEMFLIAVAAAVATVPEGLPIVVTIALAVGVARMARKNAIIRKLHAVETLGSTTVICSDKTGTLTVNEMTLVSAFDGERNYSFTGSGYEPKGLVSSDVEESTKDSFPTLNEMLRVGLLCNESRLVSDENGYKVEGDPTEGALIVAALKAGLDLDTERLSYPEISMLPFESDRGYMATLHEHDGNKILFVKGGHDRLIDLCSTCAFQEGMDRKLMENAAKKLASQGMRVLALAERTMPPDSVTISERDVADNLVFLGLVGMIDPPRAEAIDAVAGCQEAGIRVLMITGDHADTAHAIAGQLGITEKDSSVVTGSLLNEMDDETLDKELKEVSVYARIAPQDKHRIVNRLKESGHIVAVTGDGVNDAPALKAAHIGVAMGKGGTDVAREASDMVLTDDNFSSIYNAVREGRIVFDNLRKVIFFLLPTGIAAVWSILATIILGLPIPYVAAQLLWINLVTNGMQDVALAFEPGESGVERKPPRPPKEGIINRLLLERTIMVSLVVAAGVLVAYKVGLGGNIAENLEHARTMAMTTMVLCQFFQAINSRSEWQSIFSMSPFSNRFLFISMTLAVIAQIAVVYVPGLQWIFRTSALSVLDWVICIGISTSVIVLVEIDKAFRRSRR